MDMKTLLLYAAIASGGFGAGALVMPLQNDKIQQATNQDCEGSGNIQRRGPPPSMSPSKGF
jgi:hypothetical protein